MLVWLLAYWYAVARVFRVIAREWLLCSGWLLSGYFVVIIISMIFSSHNMIQDPLSVNVSGVCFFFGMFHHLSGENYPVAYTSNVSVCHVKNSTHLQLQFFVKKNKPLEWLFTIFII